MILYSVWKNGTDELIILDGTAAQCATALEMSIDTFYSAASKAQRGIVAKWHIEKRRVPNSSALRPPLSS